MMISVMDLPSTIPAMLATSWTMPETLSRAGFQHARLVLVSMPNINEALRILQVDRPPHLPVVVRVFEEEHAHEIERNGGISILNSHAAAENFMEWFAADMRAGHD